MSDDFAAWMVKVDRALANLATGVRAGLTSVKGGATNWRPQNHDNRVLRVGQTDDGEHVGLYVFGASSDGNGDIYVGTAGVGLPTALIENPDHTGHVLLAQGGKLHSPLIASAWQLGSINTVDTYGRPTVTSGTYVSTHQTVLPVTSGRVLTWLDVFIPAGTVADVKITAQDFDTLGATANVVEWTNLGTSQLLSGVWDVPAGIFASSMIGRVGFFVVHVRRVSGAGTIAIAPRIPLLNRI